MSSPGESLEKLEDDKRWNMISKQKTWTGNERDSTCNHPVCLTLCDPMDCSIPGFTVHHQLPEPTQTHIHLISDVIKPSHPLSSPSPPAFNLSQHQCLFKWISSSHQVAKVLEFQLQHQPFQWIIQNWFPLGWTGWISLQFKGLSRVFPNTTVQKHLQ